MNDSIVESFALLFFRNDCHFDYRLSSLLFSYNSFFFCSCFEELYEFYDLREEGMELEENKGFKTHEHSCVEG
jgi:hypothetical protein